MTHDARNLVSATGSVSQAKELATKIAIAVLQYHGGFIAKCNEGHIKDVVAPAYFNAFKDYVETRSNKGRMDIFINDVIVAMLGEYGIKKLHPKLSSLFISETDFQVFAGSKVKAGKEKNRWLSDILQKYGTDSLEAPTSSAASQSMIIGNPDTDLKQNTNHVKAIIPVVAANNYHLSAGASSASSTPKKNINKGASATTPYTSNNKSIFYSLPSFASVAPNIYNLANNSVCSCPH